MSEKVVLITGGSKGIGKETARIMASRGAKVIITGRDAERGESTVGELREFGHVDFKTNDVDDETSAKALISGIVADYGRLDLAVNNAGISNETLSLDNSDSEKYQAMINTNILGLYFCMKAEIKQMLCQGGGSIVNLASIAGLNGIPWSAPYASTKHAVVGLTKSSALENATNNIRINAVAPGAIKTDLIAEQIEMGTYDEAIIVAMHPMARMGKPEEIAAGICWLLSDEASFVTGHVLNIDGGFQAK